MLGRSYRSRGVCEGDLYVKTGDIELEFMQKLKATKYSEKIGYIDFLNYLKNLGINSTKPVVLKNGRLNLLKMIVIPEIEVVHEQWLRGKTVNSLN